MRKHLDQHCVVCSVIPRTQMHSGKTAPAQTHIWHVVINIQSVDKSITYPRCSPHMEPDEDSVAHVINFPRLDIDLTPWRTQWGATQSCHYYGRSAKLLQRAAGAFDWRSLFLGRVLTSLQSRRSFTATAWLFYLTLTFVS